MTTVSAANIALHRRRFSVDEYYRMAESGILSSDERIELLDGELIVKSPSGPRHAESITRLSRLFHAKVGDRGVVRIQMPLRIDRFSEPEPDIALVRPRAGGYGRSHPVPDDAMLVAEVADSSLLDDRRRKTVLYARAGIAEYWIVNLVDQRIERYRNPTADGYGERIDFAVGRSLASEAFGDIDVSVADVVNV